MSEGEEADKGAGGVYRRRATTEKQAEIRGAAPVEQGRAKKRGRSERRERKVREGE